MKKISLLNILITTCALFVLSSCNYKVDKLSGQGAGNEGFNADQLDFVTVMEKVIKPKCFECHSVTEQVKDGVAFDSYAEVIENLADIKSDIEDGSMPKRRAPLTADEKALVFAWIAAGAPEFATAPTPPVEPPTNPPVPPVEPTPQPPVEPPVPPTDPVEPPTTPEPVLDYATIHIKVIEPLCFKCHQAPNDKGDVNLESYEEVIKNIVGIKETIEDGSMPRKRTITPEQKTMILDWIAAGAPEKALIDSKAQAEKESMTSALVQFLFSQKERSSKKGN